MLWLLRVHVSNTRQPASSNLQGLTPNRFQDFFSDEQRLSSLGCDNNPAVAGLIAWLHPASTSPDVLLDRQKMEKALPNSHLISADYSIERTKTSPDRTMPILFRLWAYIHWKNSLNWACSFKGFRRTFFHAVHCTNEWEFYRKGVIPTWWSCPGVAVRVNGLRRRRYRLRTLSAP